MQPWSFHSSDIRSMEYPVKAQQTINVTLGEDSKALNEVVL
jgi:hypothetical protein